MAISGSQTVASSLIPLLPPTVRQEGARAFFPTLLCSRRTVETRDLWQPVPNPDLGSSGYLRIIYTCTRIAFSHHTLAFENSLELGAGRPECVRRPAFGNAGISAERRRWSQNTRFAAFLVSPT